MGKAGRWLRSFLTSGKDRKGKDKGDSQPSSLSTPAAVPAPSAKEKRRWSFRRPPAATNSKEASHDQGQLASSTSSLCFPDVHAIVQHDQLAAVAAPPAPERSTAGDDVAEKAAAVRIQAAFRSYLARKALCALRGMVKLQAMVRGQLVRRQTSMTLRRMQALVAAQKRARAERLRLLDEDKDKHTGSPRPPTSRRSSPQHHRSRHPLEVVDRGSEENVRVVEVDNGGGGGDERGGTAKRYGRRSTCCSAPPVSRTRAAKAELYHKVSPTPSALTDASARTMSGRFDDYSFSAAASEASGRHHRGATAGGGGGGDHAAALQQLFPKNYMSNTESSRAKARSQSAPRQRHDQASAAASPSPSPSCGEWTTPGERRRRASLDPRDLAAAGGSGRGARMERCASQARASASAACPWAVRLDRSTASLAGSDCGSSATVVTAATAALVAS